MKKIIFIFIIFTSLCVFARLSLASAYPFNTVGRILLQVEENGEAWYVYPENRLRYYLGRPDDASALMAVSWARGEELTNQKGLEEIIQISDFELKKYGEYRDVSAHDTVDWIFKDYFSFEGASLRKSITSDDIIGELRAGNLVIVPLNGQILRNPFFTPPGPIRHMLLIRGYDPNTDEFITNEPGTRHGEGFRYKTDVLYSAIADYPTGFHEHIDGIWKNMIVVGK